MDNSFFFFVQLALLIGISGYELKRLVCRSSQLAARYLGGRLRVGSFE